ncbi:hypothetical protein ACIBQ1_09485 [Nonomuraea sp. NPDC050153]|uniref:hypothetical protein n=1 Tax=Nonomuraea sp. NPDC050153 TaxID=3364359 RepID=UPI00379F6658
MISQEQARTLARKYRSKVDFITRLAAFSAALAGGANKWDALRRLGITSHPAAYRYARWEQQLRSELAAARSNDTPNDEGDEQQ